MIEPDTFIIICKDDEGTYELATRQVFTTREEADHYAAGVAASRWALVIPGRWQSLRPPKIETTPAPKAQLIHYVVTGTVFFGSGFNLSFECASEDEARQLAHTYVMDTSKDYAQSSALNEICIETVEEE